MIADGGGNIAVQVGNDGIMLVDTGAASATQAVAARGGGAALARAFGADVGAPGCWANAETTERTQTVVRTLRIIVPRNLDLRSP